LKKLDNSKDAGLIILAVDSSFIGGWRSALSGSTGNRIGMANSLRVHSFFTFAVESSYSQPKLELCGVSRILKKLKTLLWGQHFQLQVDAQSLIQMFNSLSLPNAPMTRWVVFIRLFSFDMVHNPGKTFMLPDALSR
jgi:hypothetical protein